MTGGGNLLDELNAYIKKLPSLSQAGMLVVSIDWDKRGEKETLRIQYIIPNIGRGGFDCHPDVSIESIFFGNIGDYTNNTISATQHNYFSS